MGHFYLTPRDNAICKQRELALFDYTKAEEQFLRRRRRLIPLSQVHQYLGAGGGVRNRGWVRLFREVLIGLPACRSLSSGVAAGAGLSARLCEDCRGRRYPSSSSGDGARRAQAWAPTRSAGRTAD